MKESSEADSFLRLNKDDSKDIMQMSSESPQVFNKVDEEGNLLEKGILLKPTDSQNGEKSSPKHSIDNELNNSKNLELSKSGSKEVPKDSTGGSGEGKNGKSRKDRFGTKISRGKKKHKVTFKDQVGKGRVAKVYYVESFKKYNVETTSNT